MSDDDEFMPSADEDDFDFGYDGSGSGSDFGQGESDDMADDTNLENRYYNAKAYREDEPENALKMFLAIVDTDNRSEFAVKALKQALKLKARKSFESPQLPDLFSKFVATLLTATSGDIYKEKSLVTVFEAISTPSSTSNQSVLPLYNDAEAQFTTATGNPRLLARTRLLHARSRLDVDEFESANGILDALADQIGTRPVEDDSWRTAMYLDYLALRMEVSLRTNTIDESLDAAVTQEVRSQLVHPRTLAIITEYQGVIDIRRQDWAGAREKLLKSFRHHDEAGSVDRVRVLKYYILVVALNGSGINPFDAQETKAYRNDPNLGIVGPLVEAFLAVDRASFSSILVSSQASPDTDPIVRSLLPLLWEIFQQESLLKLVRPYKTISYAFLMSLLEIDAEKLSQLVSKLILDDRLQHARMDDVAKVLHLDQPTMVAHECELSNDSYAIPLPIRYGQQSFMNERERNEQKILRPTEDVEEAKVDKLKVLRQILRSEVLLHHSLNT